MHIVCHKIFYSCDVDCISSLGLHFTCMNVSLNLLEHNASMISENLTLKKKPLPILIWKLEHVGKKAFLIFLGL